MWKNILKCKTDIGRLMGCGSNFNLSLTGLKGGSSLQRFCEALATPRQPDPLAKGIWSKKPTKYSVFLWRLRWGHLPSFTTLRLWGVPAPSLCILCNQEPETIGHIFFNCPFSRHILIACSEYTNHIVWRNMNLQVPQVGDIRFGDVLDCIQSLRSGSNCWRLLWTLIGGIT